MSDSEENPWHALLKDCDYTLVAKSLMHQFKGAVIKNELAALLHAYSANPSFETAIALLKYAPDLVICFQESKPGRFFDRHRLTPRSAADDKISSQKLQDVIPDLTQQEIDDALEMGQEAVPSKDHPPTSRLFVADLITKHFAWWLILLVLSVAVSITNADKASLAGYLGETLGWAIGLLLFALILTSIPAIMYRFIYKELNTRVFMRMYTAACILLVLIALFPHR